MRRFVWLVVRGVEYYAGIDVSLKESSVCVVDAAGKVVREVKVASEPEALVRYFDELDLAVSRIGLEAGPLSQWLHAGLMAAGRDAVLLETRHVKAALSAMTVKTTGRMRGASLSCCEWDGIARFTRNRRLARIPAPFSLDVNSCKASFSMSNSAFAAFCGATGSRSARSAGDGSRRASGN